MPFAADLVSPLKVELAMLLRCYVNERFLSADNTGKVFSSWEQNWYQRPPAVIKNNGVTLNTGYYVSYATGQVTFTTAPSASDIITAEFYFQPVSDDTIRNILENSVSDLAAMLGDKVDITIELDQRFESIIKTIAFKKVFYVIVGEAASYHHWEVDGEIIDKNGVAGNYVDIIKMKDKELMYMTDRMHLALLSSSTVSNTPGLGIT